MECLNCNTVFQGKFCPACGQKSETKRYTFQKITNDTLTSLTNTDKGFYYNLKNLTLYPGKTINDYLDGKRKQIFNPFGYSLLAIGLYLFIDKYYKYSIFESFVNTDNKWKNIGAYSLGQQIGYFIKKYLKFFYLLNIVYLSIITWLLFKKRNFIEHLVSNTFIVGHAIIITTLLIPVYKSPIFLNPIIIICISILMYLTYKNYEERSVIFTGIFFGVTATFLLQFIIPVIIIWLRGLIF